MAKSRKSHKKTVKTKSRKSPQKSLFKIRKAKSAFRITKGYRVADVKRHHASMRRRSRNTARRKIDPATGKELSRRQFEKKYGRRSTKLGTPAYRKWKHKFELYQQILDDYIDKKVNDSGKPLSRKAARESAEMKQIIRDLHGRDPFIKAAALERTGRITPDQIELYAQKFAEEEE